MFSEVVDGATCAWMSQGMTTERWMTEIPVEVVRIGELIATQSGVLLHALMEPAPESRSGDPTPHVLRFNGRLYLEDGHHRVVRARLRGQLYVYARVLSVSPAVVPPTGFEPARP